MDKLKSIGIVVGGILLVGCLIYGGYWITKSVSYSFFYESMVEQTVREMVKPEYLRIAP